MNALLKRFCYWTLAEIGEVYRRATCDHKFEAKRQLADGYILWQCHCGREVELPLGYPPKERTPREICLCGSTEHTWDNCRRRDWR